MTLLAVGLGAIAAAAFAWLWPDDEWLGLFALPRAQRVRSEGSEVTGWRLEPSSAPSTTARRFVR